MLEALALLGADGDTAGCGDPVSLSRLAGRTWARGSSATSAACAALLEGQRAAAQVWALHAERHGQAGNEGLRRLLLAIVRDLRVVPILLSRQLARMRACRAAARAEQRARWRS